MLVTEFYSCIVWSFQIISILIFIIIIVIIKSFDNTDSNDSLTLSLSLSLSLNTSYANNSQLVSSPVTMVFNCGPRNTAGTQRQYHFENLYDPISDRTEHSYISFLVHAFESLVLTATTPKILA